MNKVKVNDFIDVLARCKGFNTEITNIVKEYMQKVISKYEKVFPNGIDASLDNNKYFIKPVNGRYSIEDFLLNRMFRSINSMEANHVDGEVSATFYPAISKISYDKSKMVRSLYSYFLKIGREKYYILKNKDIIKTRFKHTIMHELGHALKNKYDGCYDCRFEDDYKRVYDELAKLKEYNSILTPYDEIRKSKDEDNYQRCVFNGLAYCGKKKNKGFVNGNHLILDEEINESEAMEFSGYNTGTIKIYYFDGGFVRNRNLGVGYYSDCGDMFRILLGDKEIFELLYVDPEKGIKKFNSLYNDVLREFYGSEKTALDLLAKNINNLERKASVVKMNEAFARCLEQKINRCFNDANVSNDELLRQIRTYRYLFYSYDNPNRNLKLRSHQILNELEKRVMSRNISAVSSVYEKMLRYKKFHLDADKVLRKRYNERYSNGASVKELNQLAVVIKNNASNYYMLCEDIKFYEKTDKSKSAYLDKIFDSKYSYELTISYPIFDEEKRLRM